MGAGRSYGSPVNHVRAGEAVSAAVTSRATRALEQRSEYLKQRMDAAAIGNVIQDPEAAVSSDVAVGTPVYWNAANQRYEPALAQAEATSNGSLAFMESAYCLGICTDKSNATTGTITLFGLTSVPSLTGITTDTGAGLYYVSGTTAGQLTKSRPAVGVPVCYVLGAKDACDTNVSIVVLPHFGSFFDDHIHYRFDLDPSPAGDAVEDSGTYTIDNADDGLPGWLPASHASFDGLAPVGAKFGYNLARHSELDGVWPPVPLDSATLVWDQASGLRLGGIVPTRGINRLAIIDQNGIWWMSDCADAVPWDFDPASSASSSSSSDACPPNESMHMTLYFTHMLFVTDKTVVRSLLSRSNLLSITDCNDNAATAGDLEIDFNLSLLVQDTDTTGGVVFKEITEEGTINSGWVAEGIIAASSEVEITSTHSRLLDPEDPASDTVHQGIVTINFAPDYAERDLAPQIVYLSDALERDYSGITYLAFPAGRDSEVRMRINVPPTGLPGSPQMKIRAQIFGQAAGPFSAMTATYRVIPRANLAEQDVVVSPAALPLDVVTPSTGLDPLKLVEVETSAFNITAGCTVFITLARAASATPAYSSEIGFMRIGGIVVSGA